MLSVLRLVGSVLMGNQLALFQKAVREGDTSKAYTLYYSKETVRTKVDPNASLGPEWDGNTLLHYIAYHAMKKLYEDMITQHRGKPDFKNDKRQNCMHLLCATGEEGSVKRDMLQFTLSVGLPGMDLGHLLKEKDQDGNTALHLAAGAGLEECVEVLVSNQADMVALNENGLTPADLAKTSQHTKIALRLEAHMVFSQEEDEAVVAMATEPDPELLQELAEGPVAMLDQDLRSMKDKLLIETAEMLGVSLLTASTLLKEYGWSKEDLLGAWLSSPRAVCDKAGVDMPALDAPGNSDFLGEHAPDLLQGAEGATPTPAEGAEKSAEVECGICCGSCDSHVTVPCGHHFCRECWKEYLEGRIQSGDSESISCPEYACYRRVPLEVIESMVSKDMASKFLTFDLKAFVDSNPNIRWCPFPGCSQAVHKPAPPTSDDFAPLSPTHQPPEEVKGQTVHCGLEHYFCWDCLGEAHEPCTCDRWREWLDHVTLMKEKVGGTTLEEADNAASSKWLVDFSKPCPKCRSPIEKTEGCNHMSCKNCRHEFCWVCLEEWKCHNSSTGGYFSCNRYDARKKAEDMLQQRKVEVLREADKFEQISRFLHYYQRYQEHIKSLSLEEPLLDQAQAKMRDLQTSILELEATTGNLPTTIKAMGGAAKSVGGASTGMTITFDSRTLSELSSGQSSADGASVGGAPVLYPRPPVDLSFIRDAVVELLKCRRVLKASYGYGFYLKRLVSTRQFEHMQGGLEQVTELLAEAVARPHLRKPRLEIICLTRECREKRTALVKQAQKGFPILTDPHLDSLPFASSMEPSRRQRMFRDLDNYTPPTPRQRERHGSLAEPRVGRRIDEDLMQEALAESRREYEADRQMLADMELAKTLSLQRQPRPPSPESPSSTRTQGYGSTLPPRESWMDEILSRHNISIGTTRLPDSATSTSEWSPTSFDPSQRLSLTFDPSQYHSDSSSAEESNGDQSPLLSPSNTVPDNPVNKWGPVFGENEDLNLAIQESLKADLASPTKDNQVSHIPPSSGRGSTSRGLTLATPSESNHRSAQSTVPFRRHTHQGGHRSNPRHSDLVRDPMRTIDETSSPWRVGSLRAPGHHDN